MIIKDISKVTGLETDIIKTILINSNFSEKKLDELVEKKFFKDNNYRQFQLFFDKFLWFQKAKRISIVERKYNLYSKLFEISNK